MYDFDKTLPFTFGLNFITITFILNVLIPIVYFLNFRFLYGKLRTFDKDAPFYGFVKSLVYFFFFYGLGEVFFVWYDFFFMDFESPNPIAVFQGDLESPPLIVVQYWKIGILLQNLGLVLMLNELRSKIFKDKKLLYIPIVWEIIGITILILIGFIELPIIEDQIYFWAEINFLFNFSWSISLPLTYAYIWKKSAGDIKRYSFILFINFLFYGLAWGFRTRFAVYLFPEMWFFLNENPFDYHLIWFIRAAVMVFTLLYVLFGYKRLLATFNT